MSENNHQKAIAGIMKARDRKLLIWPNQTAN